MGVNFISYSVRFSKSLVKVIFKNSKRLTQSSVVWSNYIYSITVKLLTWILLSVDLSACFVLLCILEWEVNYHCVRWQTQLTDCLKEVYPSMAGIYWQRLDYVTIHHRRDTRPPHHSCHFIVMFCQEFTSTMFNSWARLFESWLILTCD